MQPQINFFGQYVALYNSYISRLNNCLSAYHLDGNQYAVVYYLFHEGPNAFENIEKCQYIKAYPLTRNIKQLLKTGYIIDVSEEKKKHIYSLTPLGEKTYRETEPHVISLLEQALGGISEEEQLVILKVFSKMKDNLA